MAGVTGRQGMLTALSHLIPPPVCLIDYLRFYIPLKNFSLIWRRHHCRWMAAKFKPMLGTQGHWAGRDLYRATPAVTQDLGFSGLIQRTDPFIRLLRHTKGCGGPIPTRILRYVRGSMLAHFLIWLVIPTCVWRLITLWYLSHCMTINCRYHIKLYTWYQTVCIVHQAVRLTSNCMDSTYHIKPYAWHQTIYIVHNTSNGTPGTNCMYHHIKPYIWHQTVCIISHQTVHLTSNCMYHITSNRTPDIKLYVSYDITLYTWHQIVCIVHITSNWGSSLVEWLRHLSNTTIHLTSSPRQFES
jgi:hypothetical protein